MDELPRLPGFRESALRRRRETVGALAEHRRAAGLSQTEVAARMGTSQSTVARLEAGEVDPRLSTLERYAEALGGRLDVELRFGPTIVTGFPVVTEIPGPPASPGWASPGRPEIAPDAKPEPLRPAARFSPQKVARPAAGPSDRRW
jgi:transcriptional regulator with XRE-family HTH domain